MTPQAQNLSRLYAAFAALDADGMAQCHADAVEFDDEVFSPNPHGRVAASPSAICAAGPDMADAYGAALVTLTFISIRVSPPLAFLTTRDRGTADPTSNGAFKSINITW